MPKPGSGVPDRDNFSMGGWIMAGFPQIMPGGIYRAVPHYNCSDRYFARLICFLSFRQCGAHEKIVSHQTPTAQYNLSQTTLVCKEPPPVKYEPLRINLARQANLFLIKHFAYFFKMFDNWQLLRADRLALSAFDAMRRIDFAFF